MAAPDGTKWGTAVGGSGKKFKLGIYTSIGDNSATTTTVTVNVQVWVWTQVSVSDTSNDFYYNANATSATTNKGDVSVKTTVNSSWSTSNQKKIKTYSHTGIAKSTAATTYNVAAALKGLDYPGASSKATVTKGTTIPALTSYTIAFSGNGGSGNTGSQTKYYGRAITLNAAPSRTGYRFAGWKWNNSGTAYGASTSWNGANASGTMYAQWTANNYYIKFDGNGATSGSMNQQTFTYDQAQILTPNAFEKTDGLRTWTFEEWNTKQDGTGTTYANGASVKNLTSSHGAVITLYAIWELHYIPPTATVSSVISDTSGIFYTGITGASINITNITAYNESYIDKIEFRVGQQVDDKQYNESEHNPTSTTDDGGRVYPDETLTINPLSTDGDFTPTFTITDGLGNERTYNLNPISVVPYSVTTTIDVCDRIDASGKHEGLGLNAVVSAIVSYNDISKNYLTEPTVSVNGEPITPTYVLTEDTTAYSNKAYYARNGTTYTRVTPASGDDPSEEGWYVRTIDWYLDWGETTGFSDGPLQFDEEFEPPVKLYAWIREEFDTGETYQIGVTGRTYLADGNEATTDLKQSFYLLSAAAGGHGLGIGIKPQTDHFHVDMNSYFYRSIMARSMAGIVQMCASTTIPKGWLLCDGRSLLIDEYPELSDALYDTDHDQYIYGSEDSEHFYIPDLSGRMPIGAGSSYNPNSKGGSEYIQAHIHGHSTAKANSNGGGTTIAASGGHTHYLSGNKDTVQNGSSYMRPKTWSTSESTRDAYVTNSVTMAAHNWPNHTHTVSGGAVGAVKTLTTGDAGNMPPYIGVNFIIATGKLVI